MHLKSLLEITKIKPIGARGDANNIEKESFHLGRIRNGQYDPLGEVGGMKYWISEGFHSEDYGLALITDKDATQYVGKLTLRGYGDGVVSVNMAWVHPKLRRRGYVSGGYDLLLRAGYKIRSDSEHTRDSQMVWQKLVQRHDAELFDVDGDSLGKIESPRDLAKAYKRGNYIILTN